MFKLGMNLRNAVGHGHCRHAHKLWCSRSWTRSRSPPRFSPRPFRDCGGQTFVLVKKYLSLTSSGKIKVTLESKLKVLFSGLEEKSQRHNQRERWLRAQEHRE